MKIYGFPLSPFVRKVLVTLAEKNLDYELVLTNPQQPNEEFTACSPFNKIPAMDDNGFKLADSTAIVTYLDANYPGTRLIPEDAKARGRAIWFEEVADTVFVPAGAPIVVNRFLRPQIFGTEGDEEAAKAGEEAIKRPLGYLEQALAGDGWFDGEFSIGDLAVASTFKTLSYAGYTLDAAAYPKLAAWYARVGERPAWRAAAEREAAVFAGSAH
jgi:glutathione S-transferase